MQLRWPRGFTCPRCGGQRARPSRRRGLLRCGQCDYQASLTAGTIFQDTRLPLRTWYRAMWWVTRPENRGECSGTAKHFGSGKLPHRLGVAAQAAARDGAAWPRTAHWPRRGRRDLCWGRRRGSARTPDAEKGAGGHRRPGRRCRDRKNPHEAHAVELPSNSCTASSKRLSNPTALSTLTAGKVTSAWRRWAIGTSTTLWPLRANQPRSCCLAFTAWRPC